MKLIIAKMNSANEINPKMEAETNSKESNNQPEDQETIKGLAYICMIELVVIIVFFALGIILGTWLSTCKCAPPILPEQREAHSITIIPINIVIGDLIEITERDANSIVYRIETEQQREFMTKTRNLFEILDDGDNKVEKLDEAFEEFAAAFHRIKA